MIALLLSVSAYAQTSDERPANTRIVHRFDFDEREAGNLEDLPKFWTSLRMPGFPRFATGTFDDNVGHDAPPSFHLRSQGRNLAYQYLGPNTRVRPYTAYRIVGYVKTANVTSAKACLSAQFLDRNGDPMSEGAIRSPYIGQATGDGKWSRIELFMPKPPPGARTIGIIAWFLQESMWDTSAPGRRHIPHVDAKGEAWFDDISVLALPRVELESSDPGHVLAPDGPQHIRALLADYDDTSLEGMLSILDADGNILEQTPVKSVIRTDAHPMDVSVAHLGPGAYVARLDVRSASTTILTKTLRFIILADSGAIKVAKNARPFGIVIDPADRSSPEVELSLLTNIAARSVKLPVWSGVSQVPPTHAQKTAADRMAQNLIRNGFAITGVLAGPPGAIVQSDGRHQRQLLDLLAADPKHWKDYLAESVVRFPDTFQSWQIGADGGEPWSDEESLAKAVDQLRTEMVKFVTVSRLALPVQSSLEPPDQAQKVGHITIGFTSAADADTFASALDRAAKRGYGRVDAYVEPLPVEKYRRLPRLADYAQRLLLARHGGAGTVYAPQTWAKRQTGFGDVTEPSEDFLVLRTIAGAVGAASPGGRLRVAPGVVCLVFNSGSKTTLALWDRDAPVEGRDHAIQLGRATNAQDVWGRSRNIARGSDGRHILRLSPLPIFVENVERWLVDLRAAIAVTPDTILSGAEIGHHELAIPYRGKRPRSGRITITGPDEWRITPREINFQLEARRPYTLPLEIRYPHNMLAGPKRIFVNVELTQSNYRMQIPRTFQVGLADVDVSATAAMDDGDLILTQTVTNRSATPLHFRGTAMVTGRPRQYRPLANLRPGARQTVVYRIANARSLTGSTVGMALRELNDGSRTHTIQLTVP